jgi:hypothetical protein
MGIGGFKSLKKGTLLPFLKKILQRIERVLVEKENSSYLRSPISGTHDGSPSIKTQGSGYAEL